MCFLNFIFHILALTSFDTLYNKDKKLGAENSSILFVICCRHFCSSVRRELDRCDNSCISGFGIMPNTQY